MLKVLLIVVVVGVIGYFIAGKEGAFTGAVGAGIILFRLFLWGVGLLITFKVFMWIFG